MSTQEKLAEALRDAEATVLAFLGDVACDGSVCGIKQATVKGMFARLQAHAAEAAQAQPQNGEWVMVPREPTRAMHQQITAGRIGGATNEVVWKSILAAAPQQAAEPVYQWRWLDVDTEDSRWWECTAEEYEMLAHNRTVVRRILYTHPQPAQDAKDAATPLKGWIFDKVDMGRGDERYICTPDGSNATTVRNESTSDHRERMLWLIADAMAKESGR